ncbi:MAG: APC family permease [Planctomycetota bacterium]|jgi:amino acid transporter
MPESAPADPAPADPTRSEDSAAPKRQLTLFDSTCIIVGIIIGAGIYESTPLIASSLPNFGWLVGAWLLGGLFSLIGALCYAELATAYPKEGGDYVYLTRGFGRAPGFLFAWAQLWVVRPGSIGAMAYVFARYANQLLPLGGLLARWYRSCFADGADLATLEAVEKFTAQSERFGESMALIIYAAASIAALTVINIVGVREGKWTQNLLTTVKVLGLAGIFLAGIVFSSGDANVETPADPGKQVEADQAPQSADDASPDSGEDSTDGEAEADKDGWRTMLKAFGFAMIFVLFTYGGWNEMAYVGAEVRDPTKNILRALVLGTVAVTLIYVLVTLAFVHCLGFEGTQNPKTTVAEDVLGVAADDVFRLTERREALLGELKELEGQPAEEVSQRRAEVESRLAWLGRLASLPGNVMCVLIAISALGAVNGMVFTGARIYYAMGRDHRLYAWLGRWSRRTHTPVWSLVIQALITLGLVVAFGLLEMVGRSKGGFASMIIFTTPVFWFFLLLVGICLFVLRHREPGTPRPYLVPAYPVIPILFCLSSLYMLYSSVDYAVKNQSWEALWSVLILVVGLALCLYDPRPKGRSDDA